MSVYFALQFYDNMKRIKIWSICIFSVFTFYSSAQTKAITEKGDTIYVYDNGTWSFDILDDELGQLSELTFLNQEVELDTIRAEFKVSSNANKQISDEQGMFIIKYDEKLWKRVPAATLNDEADYAFQSKTQDVWCVVIAEETPIRKDKLFLIAQKTMSDRIGVVPNVIKAELRNVNGVEVIRGVLQAEFSGISFVFDTYYFSNELGSVQFTTWTSEKLWERNENLILEHLNGFIVN